MNNINTIHTGKVIFYNTERAYGFITDTATNKQIFVHKSGLLDSIKMNDEVTFELTKNDKGLIAKDVRVINKYIIIIDNKEYDGTNKYINRKIEN
jgi:CspA family cold shock protein